MSLLPPAVNFHINRNCNAKCRFCFATFREVDGQLSLAGALDLLSLLRASGAEKINFAGGEPSIHPRLGEMLSHSRQIGFVTSLVTNGARLARLLDRQATDLDWVGLSVDSGSEAVEVALGRSRGAHVATSITLADRARAAGVRVKLNTVVTALNWHEDMSDLVRRLRPERWKVFQALPMDGQNDGSIEDLLIDRGQLSAFVERHQALAHEGFPPIVEDNDAMRGSYAMIDPLGRFFGNDTGRHVYSDPILSIGVEAALEQVGFSAEKFEGRGGRYGW